MRSALVLAGLALACSGLVSCGGGDDDGDGEGGGGDASTEGSRTVSSQRFCAEAEKFENTFKETNTAQLPDGLPRLRDAARELEDLGTPADLPDDAREGLGLTLDKLIALPDDTDESGLMATLHLSGAEKEKSTAFEDYLDQRCDYRAKAGH